MLFLVYEKSYYEFLIKYLKSNRLVDEKISYDSFNNALILRSQEFGFKKIEEYCRYIFYLPFLEFLNEVKLFLLVYEPPVFYRYKEQLSAISEDLIDDIVEKSKKIEEKKSESSGWFKKVLTAEIKFSSGKQKEKDSLNILAVESGTGEDIYSAVIKIKSLLGDKYKLKINIVESNLSLIDKAKFATYSKDELESLTIQLRARYFKETEEQDYRFSSKIMKNIKYSNINILSSNLREDEYNSYHMIFCNNLFHIYPTHLAKKIIEKLIPGLSKGGLLFVDIPSSDISFKGLSQVKIGSKIVFKRNDKKYSTESFHEFCYKDEPIENKIIQNKFFFFDKSYDNVKKLVNDILKQNIQDLWANYLEADIYVKKQEYKKAINQYEKVRIIRPSLLATHFNIILLNYLYKDKEQAKKEIKNLIGNLEKADFSLLKEKFNLKPEAFKEKCLHLEKMIDKEEEIKIDDIMEFFDDNRNLLIETPSVSIPDLFEERIAQAQLQESSEEEEQEELQEQEQETKQEEDSSDEENIFDDLGLFDDNEIQAESIMFTYDDEVNKEEGEDVESSVPKTRFISNESSQSSDTAGEEILEKEETEDNHEAALRNPSRMQQPAYALFLGNLNLNELDLPPDIVEKLSKKYNSGELEKGTIEEQRLRKKLEDVARSPRHKISNGINSLKNDPNYIHVINEITKKVNMSQENEDIRRKRYIQRTPVHRKLHSKLKPAGSILDKLSYYKGQVSPQGYPMPDYNEIDEYQSENVIQNRYERYQERMPYRKSPIKIEPGVLFEERDKYIKEIEIEEESFSSDENGELIPQFLIDSLNILLQKKDIEGMINILDNYIPGSSGTQKDTLDLINNLCKRNLKSSKIDPEKGLIIEGSEEIKKDIDSVKLLLNDSNLLEASLIFQKILGSKSKFDELSPKNKKRVDRIRKSLENKIKRYKKFLSKYCQSPLYPFQEDLWEVLSMLAPPDYLMAMGEKYGLEPDRLPSHLKRE